MSNPDFKKNFENSIAKLGEINTAIEANIRSKQEFSGQIIRRLGEINEKIKQLAGLITGLKNQLTTLQTQSDTNTVNIDSNTAEITNLRAQIQQLNDEKAKAIADLEQLKQQYATDVKDFQKRIDDCEEKLRQLTQQNLDITNQRDALQAELAGNGDLGKTHADEIQKLSAQHAEQLRQLDEQLKLQQADNEAKIKQLTDIIAAKDAELNQRVTELGVDSNRLQERINELTLDNHEKELIITKLQEENAALKAENQDLIQRIIAATQSIAEATNRLQELNDPAAFNQNDLDIKFQEIETSIQDISNAIQGNPSSSNPSSSVQRIPNDTQFVFENSQFTFGSLIAQLQQKAQQDARPDNKYRITIRQLKNANDISDVMAILQRSGISTKRNGSIMGGKKAKKTKKIRKQKGGYTYNNSLKRQRISTTTSSIRSSSGRGRKTYSKRN